jgi:hypothetical protein
MPTFIWAKLVSKKKQLTPKYAKTLSSKYTQHKVPNVRIKYKIKYQHTKKQQLNQQISQAQQSPQRRHSRGHRKPSNQDLITYTQNISTRELKSLYLTKAENLHRRPAPHTGPPEINP